MGCPTERIAGRGAKTGAEIVGTVEIEDAEFTEGKKEGFGTTSAEPAPKDPNPEETAPEDKAVVAVADEEAKPSLSVPFKVSRAEKTWVG